MISVQMASIAQAIDVAIALSLAIGAVVNNVQFAFLIIILVQLGVRQITVLYWKSAVIASFAPLVQLPTTVL